MPRTSKKSTIIDAALEVVEESGASHLTIDAVAAQAGFSKGGVLYHFPTKHDLLTGMVERLVSDDAARADKARDNNESRLTALLQLDYRMSAAEQRASLAIVAAAAEAPDMLTVAREHMQQRHADIRTSASDPTMASVLFLAKEGLRYLDLFDINPLDPRQEDAVRQSLAAIAGDLS